MKLTATHVRSTIFGISDSLVSTVGLLSGIDISGTTRQAIILAGVVYAFVEAFSMAVGSFLSEQSAAEYSAQGEVSGTAPYVAGAIMFTSFVIASFIPIVSYIFLPLSSALWVSILLSLVSLFIVGGISAKISKTKIFSHGLRMVVLGGAAILIGVIVGGAVKLH